jgi:hypothetical protein
MRRLRLLSLLALTGGLLVPLAVPTSAATTTPRLVAVRAAHHPGVDRVVFEFTGGLPRSRSASYVSQLIGDASGLPVRIAGRSVLQVRFSYANGHDDLGRATAPSRVTYALPNVMTVVQSGDFEAVLTYGIGLTARQPYRVFTLTSPPRVVVDIGAAFPTVARRVWLFNQARYLANTEPFFTPVWRRVLPGLPATTLLHRMYAGPTSAEQRTGLRLLLSGSTGFSAVSVSDGVGRVRLAGGCRSGGSTVSIAGQIMPTLIQLPTVDHVKIFDPQGRTETPFGHTSSIPECLEP